MKWLARTLFALLACYVTILAVVLAAMLQTPAQFSQFMRRVPEGLVWGGLPAARMWLWARRGALSPGSPAPDFTLDRHGQEGRVTLSSFRGRRPVVLVFGSYS
jgi:hypothetical protein